MKNRFLLAALIVATAIGGLGFTTGGKAQNRRGQICGDPAVRCPGGESFSAHDLHFRIPRNAVIWESVLFYAIILRSIPSRNNCEIHVPEKERLEAQALFPRHKVFTDRCAEPGNIFYTNTNSNYRFIAVYAGTTRAEAVRMLSRVKATGKYPNANLRRMSAGFNGT